MNISDVPNNCNQERLTKENERLWSKTKGDFRRLALEHSAGVERWSLLSGHLTADADARCPGVS